MQIQISGEKPTTNVAQNTTYFHVGIWCVLETGRSPDFSSTSFMPSQKFQWLHIKDSESQLRDSGGFSPHFPFKHALTRTSSYTLCYSFHYNVFYLFSKWHNAFFRATRQHNIRWWLRIRHRYINKLFQRFNRMCCDMCDITDGSCNSVACQNIRMGFA